MKKSYYQIISLLLSFYLNENNILKLCEIKYSFKLLIKNKIKIKIFTLDCK